MTSPSGCAAPSSMATSGLAIASVKSFSRARWESVVDQCEKRSSSSNAKDLSSSGAIAARSFAQLSREDLEEVQSLRLVIEPLAVRRAILHASPQELDELQRIVDAMVAMDPEAITEHDAADLDIRFHDLIYRAAKHRRLYDCWSNLRPKFTSSC